MPKIMIDVDDQVDARMRAIARRNHRSKRMEVLAAIDEYVNRYASESDGHTVYVQALTNEESQ